MCSRGATGCRNQNMLINSCTYSSGFCIVLNYRWCKWKKPFSASTQWQKRAEACGWKIFFKQSASIPFFPCQAVWLLLPLIILVLIIIIKYYCYHCNYCYYYFYYHFLLHLFLSPLLPVWSVIGNLHNSGLSLLSSLLFFATFALPLSFLRPGVVDINYSSCRTH